MKYPKSWSERCQGRAAVLPLLGMDTGTGTDTDMGRSCPGVGMKGSGGAAVGDKVPWCHSGMGQWRVLGFHRVLEFFKEGGSKLWTMQELG